jgi:glycosyltransferase involved in cell wall biosynthesis
MEIVIATSTPFHLGHLARELEVNGHNVTLIGYMPKYKLKRYKLQNIKYINLFWYLFPFSLLALFNINSKTQRFFIYFIMPILDFLVSKIVPNCDVFIGLSGVYNRSFDTVKKKYNAITICDRGSCHVSLQKKILGSKMYLNKKYVMNELSAYDKVDMITIPSEFSFKSFLSYGIQKEKLFINNYGVNLSSFRKLENSKKFNQNKVRILFVGAWNYQKGVDIINQVLNERNDVFITHIGSKSETEYLTKDNFIPMGIVQNNDLINHYNANDITVLPSRQDGFGMVLLESLACGVPIIASENTGGPDIKMKIKNKGNVFIMKSINKESLCSCIDDFKLSNKVGEVFTKEDIDYFSWKKYGERYSQVLENKINEK